MHAALDGFVRAVQSRTRRPRNVDLAALATLRKRALSSAYALQQSVERRLHALAADATDTFQQLTLPLFNVGGEFHGEDETPEWTIPALRDSRQEHDLLSLVARAAALAIGHESKLAALARLLRRIGEPAIVFTEYRDTLRHVRDLVAPVPHLFTGDYRAMSVGLRSPPSAGGLLLATDAAGEGLNLHHNCRIVVNLELPWNPMRLEQRIGRVDRIGQRRRVHAFHLIAGGTAEMRVLHRLGVRVARAQADVGTQNPLAAGASTEVVHHMPTERMEAEAASEHQRLTLSRRLAPSAVPPVSGVSPGIERHALVTFSKRRALRLRLGSAALVVFRAVLADAGGRLVACHLTPIQLQLTNGRRWSFQQLEALGQSLKDDHASHNWLDSSLAVHSAFWRTRHTRARAIAAHIEPPAFGDLQPGLFDLRAEHAWTAEQERRGEVIRERAWSATAAVETASLVVDSPQIALVLFTR